MSEHPKKRSEIETRNSILMVMLNAVSWLSRRDICRAIGRSKTPELIKIIEEYHEDGVFKRKTKISPWQKEYYVYQLANNWQEIFFQGEELDTPQE